MFVERKCTQNRGATAAEGSVALLSRSPMNGTPGLVGAMREAGEEMSCDAALCSSGDFVD